jgi:Zn-dependent protease/predicted transcriptional regulator
MKIFRLAGIDVYLHWTFILLLAWIFLAGMGSNQTVGEALIPVAFILSLFACVLLHEYGHALAARRYGIGTEHITLLPIGGIASLEKMPDDPKEELIVALAGPAVNLGIAALLLLFFLLAGQPLELHLWRDASLLTEGKFLPYLLLINLMLLGFNLIPAFPMDGGRVLRALLSMRHDRATATRIAARVGQFLAIVFAFIGLSYNWFLIIIGIFIFLGASGEANYEAQRSILSKLKVRDVLMHQFTLLHAWETVGHAVNTLLDEQEKEFLVTDGQDIIGTLSRDDLIKGLQQQGSEQRIQNILNPDWLSLSPEMELNEAYEQMSKRRLSICPVFEEGRLIGVLNQENILEAVMIENAKSTS